MQELSHHIDKWDVVGNLPSIHRYRQCNCRQLWTNGRWRYYICLSYHSTVLCVCSWSSANGRRATCSTAIPHRLSLHCTSHSTQWINNCRSLPQRHTAINMIWFLLISSFQIQNVGRVHHIPGSGQGSITFNLMPLLFAFFFFFCFSSVHSHNHKAAQQAFVFLYHLNLFYLMR